MDNDDKKAERLLPCPVVYGTGEIACKKVSGIIHHEMHCPAKYRAVIAAAISSCI